MAKIDLTLRTLRNLEYLLFSRLYPMLLPKFTAAELSRIIEMAWEDRTPFEAINQIYGLNESAVVRLMRRELKSSSFRLWRCRVAGRMTKHLQLRPTEVSRGYCPSQYKR